MKNKSTIAVLIAPRNMATNNPVANEHNKEPEMKTMCTALNSAGLPTGPSARGEIVEAEYIEEKPNR